MSELRKRLSSYWCNPDMVGNIDGCEEGAYAITRQEMIEIIDLIKGDVKPTISDYLEANKAILDKTGAKMVSIESLKEFAGLCD